MLKDFTYLKTVKELKAKEFDWNEAPKVKGVYVVVYKKSGKPKFLLPEGSGGWFKGRDPNVTKEELEGKWIDFKPGEDKILYIGHAGEERSRVNLKKRIKLYIAFGAGKPVSHREGRYIWQMADADDLEIHWKETESPREEKAKMLEEFKNRHGQKLPFANLVN